MTHCKVLRHICCGFDAAETRQGRTLTIGFVQSLLPYAIVLEDKQGVTEIKRE